MVVRSIRPELQLIALIVVDVVAAVSMYTVNYFSPTISVRFGFFESGGIALICAFLVTLPWWLEGSQRVQDEVTVAQQTEGPVTTGPDSHSSDQTGHDERGAETSSGRPWSFWAAIAFSCWLVLHIAYLTAFAGYAHLSPFSPVLWTVSALAPFAANKWKMAVLMWLLTLTVFVVASMFQFPYVCHYLKGDTVQAATSFKFDISCIVDPGFLIGVGCSTASVLAALFFWPRVPRDSIPTELRVDIRDSGGNHLGDSVAL
jgi:hypothetical protein